MSVEKLSDGPNTKQAKTAESKPTTWRGQAVQLLAIVLAVFLAKGAITEPFYVP